MPMVWGQVSLQSAPVEYTENGGRGKMTPLDNIQAKLVSRSQYCMPADYFEALRHHFESGTPDTLPRVTFLFLSKILMAIGP